MSYELEMGLISVHVYIIEYHIYDKLSYMCIYIYVSTSYIYISFIDELD